LRDGGEADANLRRRRHCFFFRLAVGRPPGSRGDITQPGDGSLRSLPPPSPRPERKITSVEFLWQRRPSRRTTPAGVVCVCVCVCLRVQRTATRKPSWYRSRKSSSRFGFMKWVHRDTGTRRHRDMETPGHGDTGTRRHRDTETPGHGDTGTRGHRDTGTRRHGDTETPGHGDTRTRVYRDTETPGHGDTRTRVYRDTETHCATQSHEL